MFRFLLLFFAYEKRDSFLPSGSWIVLFWLPAETLSVKRLLGRRKKQEERNEGEAAGAQRSKGLACSTLAVFKQQ